MQHSYSKGKIYFCRFRPGIPNLGYMYP